MKRKPFYSETPVRHIYLLNKTPIVLSDKREVTFMTFMYAPFAKTKTKFQI